MLLNSLGLRNRLNNHLMQANVCARARLLAVSLMVGLIAPMATADLAKADEDGLGIQQFSFSDSSLISTEAGSFGVTAPPVSLRDGSVSENVTDLKVPGPRFSWTQDRSYSSSRLMGNSTLGGTWLSSNGDRRLIQENNNATLLDGNSRQTFPFTKGKYAVPEDGKLVLEKYHSEEDACDYLRLTNMVTGDVDIFNDFAGSNPGTLKERTTRDWLARGRKGTRYSYRDGLISSICTAQGQDYYIAFTYSGAGSNAKLIRIEVKTSPSGTPIKDVTYTYFTSGTHSPDLGSNGDLIQVRTRELKSGGKPASPNDWITRCTQYRYYREGDSHGVAHLLKTVFAPDAVQRILDDRKAMSDADAILAKGDDDGNDGHRIKDFASRRFLYYTPNTDANQDLGTVWGSENLGAKYGGSPADQKAASTPRYMLKSASAGGCGSCGSPRVGRQDLYYLDTNHATHPGINDVVRLVIVDAVDSNGIGASRTIYGVSQSGQKLREALITDPCGKAEFWCKSWKLSESASGSGQVAEHRSPAAHRVGLSTIKQFLDPTTGANDIDTLNGHSGLIEVYEYDSLGHQSAQKVKDGANGTCYYLWSKVFLGGQDAGHQSFVVDSFTYPRQVTTIDDKSRIGTHYTYDFWPDTGVVKKKRTTLPFNSAYQNGSGVYPTVEEYYDNLGHLRWTKDGDGYITYHSYEPRFGVESYLVRDANPLSLPNSANRNPAKWVPAANSLADGNKPVRSGDLPEAIQRVSKLEFDDAGRVVLASTEDGKLGFDAAKHYTVYEPNRTLRFPYWDGETHRSLMPIEVTVTDDAGRTTKEFTLDPKCAATVSGVPVGLGKVDRTSYVSLSRNNYDAVTGKLTSTDKYHEVPAVGAGDLSTHYYREAYLYDAMGRRGATLQVVSGNDADKSIVAQVDVRVFDAIGRMVAVKQGVLRGAGNLPGSYDAIVGRTSTASRLKTVAEIEYDNGRSGQNGLVTRQTRYYGATPVENVGTQLYYTFRGQLHWIRPFKNYDGQRDVSAGPCTVFDVDWQGRPTAKAMFTSLATPPADYSRFADTDGKVASRVALSRASYDALGRIYSSQEFTVLSDGAKGGWTQTSYYYDRRDNQVAMVPGLGAATERAYDGLGREYQTRTVLRIKSDGGRSYASDGAFAYRSPSPNPEFGSSHPEKMSGGDDQVITMIHRVYNAADKAIETHTFETIDRDEKGLNLSTNNDYVRRSSYAWYDGANRMVAEADYGCGNAPRDTWKYCAIPSRPAVAPSAGSSTMLLSQLDYDSATGRLQRMTPAMAAKQNDKPKSYRGPTEFSYDCLGRVKYVAENCDTSGGVGDTTRRSTGQIAKTQYNGLGKVTTLTISGKGDNSPDQDRTTTYLYEDPCDASLATSTVYPETREAGSNKDRVKVTYSLDGLVAARTDQRGTTIQYTYNDRRQPELDNVTALGNGTDGSVRSIKREYDSVGRPTIITSYSGVDGTGTVRNQVVRHYADCGKVDIEWQSHSGKVVTSGIGSSPCVRYAFDTAANTYGLYQNRLRQKQVTYPSGRAVYRQYGAVSGGVDDLLDRVTYIRDGGAKGQILAQYSRLGAGQVVAVDYAEPQLVYTLAPGGKRGEYDGLDHLERTTNLVWYNQASHTPAVCLQYGYDDAGRRAWREDVVAKSQKSPVYLDEYYTYDGMNQLTYMQTGQLYEDKGGISGTPATEEQWNLDGLGNWSNYIAKTNGATNLSQSRDHSGMNEISKIDSSAAHIAHDAAGNMTKMPLFGDSSAHCDLTYDAWNRLVRVAQRGATLVEYEYDGRNFRTEKKAFSNGQLAELRHFYYNSDWQLLEERAETPSTAKSKPMNGTIQYVWGDRFVDDLILRDRIVDEGNERLYAMQDANWNVVAVADAHGTVADRYTYSAYGRPSTYDVSFAQRPSSLFAWDVLFAGHQYDADAGGIYDYRNRLYSADLGRFITRDPIGYKGGDANLYRYAADCPTVFVDPLGTDLFPAVKPVGAYPDPGNTTGWTKWPFSGSMPRLEWHTASKQWTTRPAACCTCYYAVTVRVDYYRAPAWVSWYNYGTYYQWDFAFRCYSTNPTLSDADACPTGNISGSSAGTHWTWTSGEPGIGASDILSTVGNIASIASLLLALATL